MASTMYYELTPAYGRDYKNKAQVVEDFEANKDFNGDYQLGFQLVSKEQLPKGSTVNLRYDKNRKVAVVKVAYARLQEGIVCEK